MLRVAGIGATHASTRSDRKDVDMSDARAGRVIGNQAGQVFLQENLTKGGGGAGEVFCVKDR
jgi:hypothetical protein